jgi:hypothetical protein
MEGGPTHLCCGRPLSVGHVLSDCQAKADLINLIHLSQVLREDSQAARQVLRHLAAAITTERDIVDLTFPVRLCPSKTTVPLLAYSRYSLFSLVLP